MVVAFIVGTTLIVASFVYTDHRQDVYEDEMRPYDAAIYLVEQVNHNGYLRGVGVDGKEYGYVVLSKMSLEWYADHPGRFEENITSEFHYRITFDDLNISDEDHNPVIDLSSFYIFGETPPRGADVVKVEVHYAIHLRTLAVPHVFYEDVRHVCLMTVEVWP